MQHLKIERNINSIIRDWDDYEHFLQNKALYYKKFTITTRSKPRNMCEPQKGLKEVQKAVQDELQEISLPSYINGFTIGRSVKTNADPHTGKAMVSCYDVEGFFPSIDAFKIRRGLKKFLSTNSTINLLTNLAEFENGLPQGAPLSPVLANMAFSMVDEKLVELASNNMGSYSRFADDFTISSNDMGIRQLSRYVRLIVQDYGFELSTKKTRHNTQRRQQIVLGVIVNEKAQPTKGYRKLLKAKIHNAATSQDLISNTFLKELEGQSAWVEMFNKHYAAKYLKPKLNIIKSRLKENKCHST